MSNFDKIEKLVSGKKVDVLGAGISNMPAINLLKDLGADITVHDRNTREKMKDRADLLDNIGVRLICGDSYLENLSGEIILRSPGIRPDLPAIFDAIHRGAYLTSEMELFLKYAPCPIIAITGSAGKTTTTTLTSLLAREYLAAQNSAGKVYVGGNIGHPLLSELDKMTNQDMAVVELSSFQLMTTKPYVECAVITNVTPNHLDWHEDMNEYIKAKSNIIQNAERAVLNYSDTITRAFSIGKHMPITFFSRGMIPYEDYETAGSAISLSDGKIVRYSSKNAETLLDTKKILLPGPHNIENYMAAIGAMGNRDIKSALGRIASTFGGVKHRLEFVRSFNGVKYYNSSIDSAPERTAAALSALPDDKIILICGGYDKKLPYDPLAEAVCKHGKVKTVVITGATADKIEQAFNARGSEVPQLIRAENFNAAVRISIEIAKSGDTVLLSPASASFDEFPNFEVRGERFREIVEAL